MNPYVFVHIPKNAGRAFWITINSHTGLTLSPHRLMSEYFRLPIGNYDMYGGHSFYKTLGQMIPDGRYITLLRDPINRIYSHWQYLCDGNLFGLYGLGDPKLKFSEFIRAPQTQNLASNFQCRYLTADFEHPSDKHRLLHQLSIEQKVIDLTGASEVAIASLRDFAYVGTQERFVDAVNDVCKIMGFDPPSGISQEERNYYDRISPRDIEYLMEVNAEDWAIYNEFK